MVLAVAVGAALLVAPPSGAVGSPAASSAGAVPADGHDTSPHEHGHDSSGLRVRGERYRKSDGLRTKLRGARPAMEVPEAERASLRRANASLDADHFTDSFNDPAMWVDQNGALFHVDPLPRVPASGPTAPDPVLGSHDLSEVMHLHSSPGSNRTLFIDFDGGLIENTYWNSAIGPFVEPPFSLDEDTTTLNNDERLYILDVWMRVAEDYAPFNVDVTTEDPGFAAIDRSGSSDQTYGTRAMIAQGSEIASSCGCSGIAYVGVSNITRSHSKFQPAFVFPGDYGPASTANTISHETGHNFGLSHDGLQANGGTIEYWDGNELYDVIMGSGWGALSQWSNGTYTGANNTEDDLAVINAHGGTYRADDHGNTAASATSLSGSDFSAEGIVTSSSDVDVFSITVPAGLFEVTALPTAVGPNLDIRLELRDASGSAVIGVADPPTAREWTGVTGLGATFSTVLAAGTYTLWVRGTGFGNQNTVGYPAYGSLGRYRLIAGRPRLTVNVVGSGTVSASSGSITSCASSCTAAFDLDTRVDLEPTPAVGWKVASVTGADNASPWSPYVTTNSALRTVTITFEPKTKYTVAVSKSGGGSGTVTSSPAGINCGATCSYQFAEGEYVDLQAAASPGSVFTGWTGDCAGTTPYCSLSSLDGQRSVVANFAPAYALTLSVISDYAGVVSIDSLGSDCSSWGGPCTVWAAALSTVTLTARSLYGYAFSSWGPTGACTGTARTCTVTMSSAKSVTANFVQGKTLVISQESDSEYGGIYGEVSASELTEVCKYTCEVTALSTATVTLAATAKPWARFTGWSGVCSGTSTTCQVKMADINDYDLAKANFAAADVQEVIVSSSDADRVQSSPPGIDCGVGNESCQWWFPTGSNVTITATPGPNRVVVSWGESLPQCPKLQLVCTFTASEAITVSPDFELTPYRVDVAKQGAGTGTVSSDVGGLSCDAACTEGSAVAAKDTLIALTAVAGPESVFGGWSGACAHTAPVCAVRVAGPAAKQVVAKFVSSAKPEAPTGTGVFPGNKQVVVSWMKPANPGGAKISDYLIERSVDGGPWQRIKDGKSTKTRYTVKSLRNGVPYRFRVAALSKWGAGPWVETLPATPRTKPSAPKILLVTPGDGQLALTWVPGSNGGAEILDYLVEYSTNGRKFTVFPHDVSSDTSITITGLVNAKKYWVRLAAVNAAGTGARSKAKTAKPVASPLPPPPPPPLRVRWPNGVFAP